LRLVILVANSRSGKGESAEKCSYAAIAAGEERVAEMTKKGSRGKGRKQKVESRRQKAESRKAEAEGNRHRGESHLSSPATPPDMRVRIRRFGGLS
jgi:hypothetical protein